MPKTKFGYIDNGLLVTPSEFSLGDIVKVTYHGPLTKSGADEVYAHVGFGSDEWKNITNIKMSKTKKGFEAKIPVLSNSKLNMVFRDDKDSWDNNSGKNYSITATQKYKYDNIYISPNEFCVGDTVIITYKGYLCDYNPDNIYAHAGYGDNWDNSSDIKMSKTSDGYTAKLTITSSNSLHVAFKDTFGNWDNNSSKNYTLY